MPCLPSTTRGTRRRCDDSSRRSSAFASSSRLTARHYRPSCNARSHWLSCSRARARSRSAVRDPRPDPGGPDRNRSSTSRSRNQPLATNSSHGSEWRTAYLLRSSWLPQSPAPRRASVPAMGRQAHASTCVTPTRLSPSGSGMSRLLACVVASIMSCSCVVPTGQGDPATSPVTTTGAASTGAAPTLACATSRDRSLPDAEPRE